MIRHLRISWQSGRRAPTFLAFMLRLRRTSGLSIGIFEMSHRVGTDPSYYPHLDHASVNVDRYSSVHCLLGRIAWQAPPRPESLQPIREQTDPSMSPTVWSRNPPKRISEADSCDSQKERSRTPSALPDVISVQIIATKTTPEWFQIECVSTCRL